MGTFFSSSEHEIRIAFARYNPTYVFGLLQHVRTLCPNVGRVIWTHKNIGTFWVQDDWIASLEDGPDLRGHIDLLRVDQCSRERPFEPPIARPTTPYQWGAPVGFTISTYVHLVGTNRPSIMTVSDHLARIPRPIHHLHLNGIELIDSLVLLSITQLCQELHSIAPGSLTFRMESRHPDYVFRQLFVEFGTKLNALTLNYYPNQLWPCVISFGVFRRFVLDIPKSTPTVRKLSLNVSVTREDESSALSDLADLHTRGGHLDQLNIHLQSAEQGPLFNIVRLCYLFVRSRGSFKVTHDQELRADQFISDIAR